MHRIRAVLRHWSVRVLGVVVLMVLAVSVASYIAAQHIADRAHVVARVGTMQDDGEVVLTVVVDTTVTDASLVRRIQDAVNSGPAISWTDTYSCPLAISSPIYSYIFTFSWRSMVVESVDADTLGCGFWHLNTLGIAWDHDIPSVQGWHTLERSTGMPGLYQASG